jgi:YfiR/HmsC-like
LIVALFVALFGIMPTAHAVDRASVDNLQASVRTLGFLESLPKEGPLVVGVIYASDIPNSEVLAGQTAAFLSTMRGPNSRRLQPQVLSIDDLAHFEGHLDVLFLVQGATKHSDVLLDAMRRLHLVTISDDSLCSVTQTCVLMVRAGQRVEISLNTALADAVGARFSLVFMMVVNRK